MEIKAEGENPWQYAYAKLPFTANDVWIGAMQIVPGNRKMVHRRRIPGAATRSASKPRARSTARNYGLSWNTALETGGFLIGDEVKVSVTNQAVGQ